MVKNRCLQLYLLLLLWTGFLLPCAISFLSHRNVRTRATPGGGYPSPRTQASSQSTPTQRLYMAKKVSFGSGSRIKLVQGLNIVANAVKTTLGPKGRNVVLQKAFGSPEIVNDGVTIARAIELRDPEQNVGVQLIQEVANRVEQSTGDGTTTTTLLTQAIVNQGMKVLAAGSNPVALRRGIMSAASLLADKIRAWAQPVSRREGGQELLHIASIACNSPVMGGVVAEACSRLRLGVGGGGATCVEEGSSLHDEVEFSEGLRIERGFLSPYFINDNQRQVCELTRPRVLVTDQRVQSLQDILPLLESLAKSKERLCIIAEDVAAEVLSTLVVNKLRGSLDVVAVKAPSYGDRRKSYLQDIAIATGATLITEDLGRSIATAQASDLGTAERVVVGKESTTIVTSAAYKPQIQDRIAAIRHLVDSADSDFEKSDAEARAKCLGGGVARIKVGAASETELKEKKLRYEDALNSVQSALEAGVVPGGGSMLHFLATDKKLRKEVLAACGGDEEAKLGADILFRSLSEPLKQIATNCGHDGAVIADKCTGKGFGYGYNAATDKFSSDLAKEGVLDPAKVTISALQTAASIAGLILTTEVLVTDEVSPLGDAAGGGGGGGIAAEGGGEGGGFF
jgi:chaperonin GroEL